MLTIPLEVSSIPKGGTPRGVHHYMFKAGCQARAVFIAQDEAMAEASGLTPEELALGRDDDAVALATGTVGHAIMARLFQPDVFEVIRALPWDTDPTFCKEWMESLTAIIKDEARFIIKDLDKPWTAKADVPRARSAAAYAFTRLAPLLRHSTILGAELQLQTQLGESLTGALDLGLILHPLDRDQLTLVFGGFYREGVTVLDWKFIDYVSKYKNSTGGMQHLSYQTLANRWLPTLTGDKNSKITNFIYVCIEKTTQAGIKKPIEHDMMLVRKELPTPESAETAMNVLQSQGRVNRLHVMPGDHNLMACEDKYNKPCPYSHAAGGRCDQGLTF
jgi:hypothetical protein